MLFAFKKEYKPLIVSGRKTQTVRIWKPRRGYVKSGSAAYLRAGQVVKSPGLGRLRIDEVVELKLNQLTREDARLDGFKSKAEMLATIRKIYKLKQTDNPTCYRVRFKYLGDDKVRDGSRSASRIQPTKPNTPGMAKSGGPKKRIPKSAGTKKSTRRKAQLPTTGQKPGKQETLFPPF